ncbi:MAG: ferritin-like domain-containing protein [Bacteroidota bacterium]
MIERPPLLVSEPRGEIADLDALLGLANAIEVEAVTRYRQLAALMERRGEAATAAVFREMEAFEDHHVAMVAGLAERLHRRVPPAERFTWRLPPEVAESWDAVEHSTLLTPYRALAIAVTNEERTFALYSYVAAHAEDVEVARQAEALAREELSHAAELRVWRRRAYRREFAAGERRHPVHPQTLGDFQALDARLLREAAALHQGIAAALAAAGDTESARLVAAIAEREGAQAPGDQKPTAVAQDTPAALLKRALRPLEAASEVYEDVVAEATQEDLLRAAQAALHRVVEAISVIGRRLSRLEAPADELMP